MDTDFTEKKTWGPEPYYLNVLDAKPWKQCPLVVAGPCSIESEKHVNSMVPLLKKAGVKWMRGGVFRAGTYPAANYGFRLPLLKYWSKVAHRAGMKIVVEVIDLATFNDVTKYADALQIGARHMQDYALLRRAALVNKPVFLKRNMGATVDEWLGAAEYLAQGICQPVLIERGSSSHMTHVRWDLSISAIPAVKRLTEIPILVDASHGTGRRDLVESMTYAGIAAGADGFLVETHESPEDSISDADQAFPLSSLKRVIKQAAQLKKLINHANLP